MKAEMQRPNSNCAERRVVIRISALEFPPMLTRSNISVSYDGSRILRDVSLAVSPGQVVCLMGRNGAGKTAPLKSIVGLVSTDSGPVRLSETDLSLLKPDAWTRAGLGYAPQGRDILSSLSVWGNLRIGAIAQGKRLNDEVDRVPELFPVLKDMLQRKGGDLSGGQQQQLAIGRALLTNPKVLLLDAPTEGISSSTSSTRSARPSKRSATMGWARTRRRKSAARSRSCGRKVKSASSSLNSISTSVSTLATIFTSWTAVPSWNTVPSATCPTSWSGGT